MGVSVITYEKKACLPEPMAEPEKVCLIIRKNLKVNLIGSWHATFINELQSQKWFSEKIIT